MNKVAIAFLTKDKVELSKRTIEPLLQWDKFDLHWFDGSVTEDGKTLWEDYAAVYLDHEDVGGGPDAAVAFALTTLLAARTSADIKRGDEVGHDGTVPRYDFIGLVENDVLLQPAWFDRTMALFTAGKVDGLEVGAVSPRAYVDRILCQRERYALCLNLGWGVQIMTRRAAELTLQHFRTGHTLEVRRVFAQLTGVDVGKYWAFRANEHMLVADWQNDKTLAAHGLASLALVPSPVEMIGQEPSLEQQGLKLATEPVDRRDDQAFQAFVDRTYDIRNGLWQPGYCGVRYRADDGQTTVFAHQVFGLEDAKYEGDWRLRWVQGFGPFAWRATRKGDSFCCYVSGACDVMVSGGPDGGEVEVCDVGSGYVVKPRLPPEGVQGNVMHLMVPAQVAYRKIRVTAVDPGISFFGLRCREPQPEVRDWSFDHSYLPPVE